MKISPFSTSRKKSTQQIYVNIFADEWIHEVVVLLGSLSIVFQIGHELNALLLHQRLVVL